MQPHSTNSLFTDVIHAGQEPDALYGAVSVPIYQTSTFAMKTAEAGAAAFADHDSGYVYTRLGNPTVRALEESLACLEHGAGALATATGMAAVSTVFFALLERNTHVLATDSVYGATRTVLQREFSRFGVAADFVDTSNLQEVERTFRRDTRMLYLETPANPTLVLSDIRECARLAHDRDCLLVVDNTFAGPLLQNPLDLGADVVLHSLTKSINGHSDVIGGVIVPNSKRLYKRLHEAHILLGGTMDPHQAWLALRGVKTMALRTEKSQDNAMKLARWLEGHPQIRSVSYPGLETHPQHDLACAQMRGFGSIICFTVRGGFDAGRKTIDAVRLCTLAVSLGGIESLIQHPSSMTHAGVARKDREAAGITDDLIRLSVGCEGFEDIQHDLDQALRVAGECSVTTERDAQDEDSVAVALSR